METAVTFMLYVEVPHFNDALQAEDSVSNL